MGFNFPNTPTVGDLYPVPPTAGVPQYRWDGEKWTATTIDTTTLPEPLAEAMALNAIQINGGMEVSQEFGQNWDTPGWLNSSAYTVDGWKTILNQVTPGATAFSVQHVLSGDAVVGNLGIPWCLGIIATGAANFAGAGDFAALIQDIEGTRISRLGMGYPNALPVTVSFWIWSSHITGTACVLFGSMGTQYRCHIKEYTVETAGAWLYKSVTIEPETTAPDNFPVGNTAAAEVLFNFGAGSGVKTGVANVWQNWGANHATANQTNFFSVNGASVYITGVTIVPGRTGPSAIQSSLATRSYGTELAICQRYWNQGVTAWDGWTATGQLYVSEMVIFSTPMRASPTMTVTPNVMVNTGTPGATVFDPASAEIYTVVEATGVSSFNVNWKANARL